MNEKHELRKRMKEVLSRISSSEFDKWNISLSKNLSKFLSDDLGISENDVVGGFAPIQREPLWMPGVKANLAFPAYKEKMLFKISAYESLVKQMDFGVEILSPAKEAMKVVPKILLIPGLGFSLDGKRLGRGKGFYDRYLEKFTGVKIGLCFECQLSEVVPVDIHDQKMNFIVTEKNIYRT